MANVPPLQPARIFRFSSSPSDRDEIKNISFAPDGRRFVVSGRCGVKVFDINGTELMSLIEDESIGATAVWSSDGTKIAVSFSDESDEVMCVIDALTGATLARWVADAIEVASFSLSPDARRLVTAGLDNGDVIVWDVATQRQVCDNTSVYNDGLALAVAFVRDGAAVLTAYESGCVYLTSAVDGSELWCSDGESGILNLSVSADGSRFAAMRDIGKICVFSTADGSSLDFFPSGGGGGGGATSSSVEGALCIDWSRNERIAVGCNSRAMIVDAATGQIQRQTRELGSDDRARCVALSPDGLFFIVGTAKGDVIVFSLTRDREEEE